ncbi:MAG: MBL fold metallo-hydrolase [Stomatobaculum sp.]|nr:MBL fold metallo-hydrolase [Stomatobaculum sp.]
MKITMLGTGHASVTECFNSCFLLDDDGKLFLVDGGGGSTLFGQLKKSGYRWQDIRQIFVTHKHLDHLTGIFWLIRWICQWGSRGVYEGEAFIYGHDEVISILRETSRMLLNEKEYAVIGRNLHLIEVQDGEERSINGRKAVFFDIRSTKAKQFGFCMDLGNGKKLTCCGDEPFEENSRKYAEGSTWLLHEAFCLYSEADIFSPYEKHHSTVKEACETAEWLGVKNLLLYHTEDTNIRNRRKLYTAEGKKYFHGNLLVPDDLECIDLERIQE